MDILLFITLGPPLTISAINARIGNIIFNNTLATNFYYHNNNNDDVISILLYVRELHGAHNMPPAGRAGRKTVCGGGGGSDCVVGRERCSGAVASDVIGANEVSLKKKKKRLSSKRKP